MIPASFCGSTGARPLNPSLGIGMVMALQKHRHTCKAIGSIRQDTNTVLELSLRPEGLVPAVDDWQFAATWVAGIRR
jgi:hypothetical protein